MSKFKKPSTYIVAVFLCIIAAGAVSASMTIPWYQNVNLTVANANHTVRFQESGIPTNTYNYFAGQSAGQGLNALHISNNNSNNNYGQVTKTHNTTGTFYLSDTGGRGWDDDGILMIAVNGTNASLANLQIQISSAGYNWTPVSTGSYPAYNQTHYTQGISETFYGSNFFSDSYSYNSTWKPSTSANYPFYDGQNVTQDQANGNTFHMIFVDLYAGIIGPGTQSYWKQTGINNGTLQVNYTISGLPQGSLVAFDANAFCNSSNVGTGIHWTNCVNDAGNNSGGTTSGYYVASWFNP